MRYLITLGAAALIVWAVWYLVRTVRRQSKGGCACGGDCSVCPCSCPERKE